MDKRIKYGLVLIESVVLLCVLLVMGGATLPIYQQYNNLNKQKRLRYEAYAKRFLERFIEAA